MSYVMQCIGLANGQPGPANQFLAEYDNDTGESVWTLDVRGAMIFSTSYQAFEYWRQVHAKDPVRPSDGKPNRPLTAFSVVIEPLEDYEAPAK